MAARTGNKKIFMIIERTTRHGKIYQEGIQLSRVLEKEIWKRNERGDIFKRSNRKKKFLDPRREKRVKLPFIFSIVSASPKAGHSALILVLFFHAVTFPQISGGLWKQD